MVIHSVRQPHPLAPAVATKASGRPPSAEWTLDPLSAQAQGSLCTTTLRHDGGDLSIHSALLSTVCHAGLRPRWRMATEATGHGIFLHGTQSPKMMVEENESIVNKETRNYRLKNLPSKSPLVS